VTSWYPNNVEALGCQSHSRSSIIDGVLRDVKRADLIVSTFTIALLDHRSREMAQRVHALQIAAYRLEADLLGVKHFPPLERSVEDVQSAAEELWGAWEGEELLGVIGLERFNAAEILISSLTVAPGHHRRGVGRALVLSVLDARGSCAVAVSTGAKNDPALQLYKQLGFIEHRRRHVGLEPVEVVELRVDGLAHQR
jgi:ribosomal protein S18 acetylase RimI-like enzyme